MKKMKITVVGKIKKNNLYYLIIQEYKKRMEFYVSLDVYEIIDPSILDKKKSFDIIEQKMKKRIEKNDHVICFDITRGIDVSSTSFSKYVENIRFQKIPHFFIGGSLGLPVRIINDADWVIRFGKNTYAHKLFRLMVYEQLYRAMTIINDIPYHK